MSVSRAGRQLWSPLHPNARPNPSIFYTHHQSAPRRSYVSVPEPPKSTPQSSQPQKEAFKTEQLLGGRYVDRFLPRLRAVSQRTGVPLPSLVISFLVLHEITAVVPVVFLYFLFYSLGLGTGLIAWITGTAGHTSSTLDASSTERPDDGERSTGARWTDWRGTLGRWIEEGDRKFERVGKRYGIFGYDKHDKSASEGGGGGDGGSDTDGVVVVTEDAVKQHRISANLASFTAAYVVVKVSRTRPGRWLK